jgi:hypothetical protein
LADVHAEKITPEHARSAYGVVLEASGERIAEEETAQLRARLRGAAV